MLGMSWSGPTPECSILNSSSPLQEEGRAIRCAIVAAQADQTAERVTLHRVYARQSTRRQVGVPFLFHLEHQCCSRSLFSLSVTMSFLGSSLPSTSSTRICILGGGFGGLYTAVRLQSLMWPQGKKPQAYPSL